MNNIERVRTNISRKLSQLDPDTTVIDPEANILDAGTQAQWMIALLKAMYVNHGITREPEEVKKSIEIGDIRCWFAVRKEQPIAIASLIRQKDKSQELGRSVSLERGNGIGGLLMLTAGLNHLLNNTTPLIAEVRVAGEFEDIPSGLATQKICFDHLGLKPHALVPAFHHGDPDRNEPFAFSSSLDLKFSEPMIVPEDATTKKLLGLTAVALAKLASPSLKVTKGKSVVSNTGWISKEGSPFSVIVPGDSTSSLDTTIEKSEQLHPFTLLPIEMSPGMTGAIIDCLNRGFIPCGVDRTPGKNGHPTLMLGKLRKGTLLAPHQFMEGTLHPEQQRAMERIDLEFRKSL